MAEFPCFGSPINMTAWFFELIVFSEFFMRNKNRDCLYQAVYFEGIFLISKIGNHISPYSCQITRRNTKTLSKDILFRVYSYLAKSKYTIQNTIHDIDKNVRKYNYVAVTTDKLVRKSELNNHMANLFGYLFRWDFEAVFHQRYL